MTIIDIISQTVILEEKWFAGNENQTFINFGGNDARTSAVLTNHENDD